MARSGDLQVTKECSAYKGLAGDFCTITSSSLDEIGVGSKVIYAQAAEAGSLDTDVVLDAGSGNTAAGHVKLEGPRLFNFDGEAIGVGLGRWALLAAGQNDCGVSAPVSRNGSGTYATS